jgi:methionine biosynthesis protein MetW
MFYFSGTRKPNYKNLDKDIYASYWKNRGYKMRDKLMEREYIFLNWIKPNSKVLSVGCGNSRLLYELKKQKQCEVFGIDISPEVVNVLKQNNISAEVQDVIKQDFSLANNYDYIIMSELLEHLVMPEDLLEQVRHKAKYLILSVPNSAFYRYRLGLLFKGRFFTQWAKHPSEHLRYWSHKDFIDWLKALSFKIKEFEPSNGFFLKKIWPNMFGHQICYLIESNN